MKRTVLSAVAATGLLAGFAAVSAGPASAAPMCTGSACSTYSGQIVISSALSLFPSAGTFPTLTVAPGAGQQPIAPFILDVDSTDSAGATLSVAGDPANSPNLPASDFASDAWSFASTPVKSQVNFNPGAVMYQLTSPTGNIASHCGGNYTTTLPAPCTVAANGASINGTAQPQGSDILSFGFYITVPAGTPGSPASGYATAFDLSLIGS